MTQTALGAALVRAGIPPEDVEFDIAIARYINLGGTIARALVRLDAAAARMPGMGQYEKANSFGRVVVAHDRQQIEDSGHSYFVSSDAEPRMPKSSSSRGGDSLNSRADGLTKIAIPVSEPTRQQRAASAVAANVMAITIMDTLKIDGRSIGNWTVSEARKSGHLKTREGYILIHASRMVANANGSELLRHVVKAKELQKIIQKAAEVADAV